MRGPSIVHESEVLQLVGFCTSATDISSSTASEVVLGQRRENGNCSVTSAVNIGNGDRRIHVRKDVRRVAVRPQLRNWPLEARGRSGK